MKKKIYLKPSSNVIRLNINDQLLDNKMGNQSLPHVGGDSYEGDEQGAKRYTLSDEEDGWSTIPKSNSLWDD